MRLTDDIKKERMKKRLPLFIGGAVILVLIIGSLFRNPPQPMAPAARQIPTGNFERIVSLAPSVTEILYAIGAGDKVVGVSEFCRFPPEATLKPKVGGLLDPNFESIYQLDPSLIILLSTNVTSKPQFDKMSIPTLEVGTNSVEEVLGGIQMIGKALKKENEAKALIDSIVKKVSVIKSKTKDLPRPTVLIIFWRAVGEGKIREAYIAGSDKFHNQLIDLAGGKNAYETSREVISPLVSAEGILKMDPDFIIEVMSEAEMSGFSNADLLEDWKSMPELKAYKNKHIYVLNKSYMGIPGPRLTNALEDMARTIHPEVKW